MTIIDYRPDLDAGNVTGVDFAPAGVTAASSPLAEDWWMLARCRTVSDAGTLFFSEELTEIGAAKRICAECPVIGACLEGAIARAEPCGVWGGQLFEKGRILLVKRKRGRPPKNPRPEDQLPHIPIPEYLQRRIA